MKHHRAAIIAAVLLGVLSAAWMVVAFASENEAEGVTGLGFALAAVGFLYAFLSDAEVEQLRREAAELEERVKALEEQTTEGATTISTDTRRSFWKALCAALRNPKG